MHPERSLSWYLAWSLVFFLIGVVCVVTLLWLLLYFLVAPALASAGQALGAIGQAMDNAIQTMLLLAALAGPFVFSFCLHHFTVLTIAVSIAFIPEIEDSVRAAFADLLK